ncbi:hypothetical protein Tco_0127496 [Tanacetum coccineum]
MDGTPMEINMLVEKKYPLIKELLEKMLNLQLEAEEESTMAFELIKFIKSMLEEGTTLAEPLHCCLNGIRPPMLEKSMYDSWTSRIRLFIKGKKHGRMMLDSIDNDDYDVQATNIILHGLPPDVYALVNHQKVAKDIWDRVKMLMKGETLYEYCYRYSQLINNMHTIGMDYATKFKSIQQGEDLIECINKAMAFLSVVASRFPPSNNQLRTSSNPRNQATIQDGRVTVQQVQGRQHQSYAEGHMVRQCTELKRPRNATWFKEKLMLAEAQEACQILDEEQLEFLADPGISEAPVSYQTIPQNSAFHTDDLDAYDSDCDDLSSAKVVLMANLSSCDPEVLYEVPYSKSYSNDMINQDVQEMQYSEQIHVDDFEDNEIYGGSNIIPYFQYLQRTQDAVILRILILLHLMIYWSNIPILSASGSKPSGNTKNNRISRPPRSNQKNKVEDHPRTVKSSLNKMNSVSKPMSNALVKHSVKNAKFESMCAICNKYLFDANHDMCLVDFVNDVNRYKWKPTGRFFTIVGNSCPLTRITPKKIVHLKEITPKSAKTPKPDIKFYSRRPKQIKSVGSSKKAKIVESKIANNSEPTHLWGSNATDVPSSSFIVNDRLSRSSSRTVRFRNDQVAKIMGYGDYQQGNVIISRVYYVEGLRHNLFSVGKFCDADLEVAFQKNTCFIRNLEGVDLLSGSRDTNLYTISLDDMLKTSSICLLSKASKTKSWAAERRSERVDEMWALCYSGHSDGGLPVLRLVLREDESCEDLTLHMYCKYTFTFIQVKVLSDRILQRDDNVKELFSIYINTITNRCSVESIRSAGLS